MTAVALRANAEVQTTDATTTTLYEDTTGVNGAFSFLVSAMMTGASRVDYRSWMIHAARFTTFEASQLLSQSGTEIGSGGSATWTAVCDLNGANIRVRVTGAVGVNIDWKVAVTALRA